MRLLQSVLATLPQTKKPQRKFITHLLGLVLMLPGHATFRNLSRYSSYHERTFARWHGRPFDLGSVAEKGRVGDWRGNGRRMGVAVPGSFRNAGASLPAMAPFPVAALRTGQADLPHPALQWDHAFRTRNTLATAGSR